MKRKKICHVMIAPEDCTSPTYLSYNQSTVRNVAIGLIAIILMGASVGIYYTYNKSKELVYYKEQLQYREQELELQYETIENKNKEIQLKDKALEAIKDQAKVQQEMMKKVALEEGMGGPFEEDNLKAEEEDVYEPNFYPCEGNVTSWFGQRNNPFSGEAGDQHKGMDIGAAKGAPIYAAAKGTVKEARYMNGYGYAVFIDHQNGMETRYAHASKLYVKAGQEVEKGEKIAAVGSTGNSTGPHLHFEIRENGKALDPTKILYKEKKDE